MKAQKKSDELSEGSLSTELAKGVLHGEVLPPINPTAEVSENRNADLLDDIILYISRTYLRRDGRYYLRADPTVGYSMDDAKHALLTTIPDRFGREHVTEELLKQAFRTTFIEKHDDRSRKIPVWNGKVECRPGNEEPYVFEHGVASINIWEKPTYRLLPVEKPSTKNLDILLSRIMPHEIDRRWFKDWLAWNLQNEHAKPGYAPMLYSANKGTGKSTLIALVAALFGENNSINCKSVDDITGRFSAPIFEKKFISVEEVKLQQGTQNANKLKTYITETKVAVERKGQNIRQVDLACPDRVVRFQS